MLLEQLPQSRAPFLSQLVRFQPGSLQLALNLFSASLVIANYPTMDKVPPIDSPEVKEWIAQVKAKNPNIPNVPLTVDGSCASDPALAANASAVCWFIVLVVWSLFFCRLETAGGHAVAALAARTLPCARTRWRGV